MDESTPKRNQPVAKWFAKGRKFFLEGSLRSDRSGLGSQAREEGIEDGVFSGDVIQSVFVVVESTIEVRFPGGGEIFERVESAIIASECATG
jgi:hypothetical protein